MQEPADINNVVSTHEEAEPAPRDAYERSTGGASDSNTNLVSEVGAYGFRRAMNKMPMRISSEERDDVDFDEPAFLSKTSSVEASLSSTSKKRRLRSEAAVKDFSLTMDAAEPPVRKPRVSVRTRSDSTTVSTPNSYDS